MAAAEPVLLASNRGYRYGDGLFETMKMINGQLILADYHFERLFAGLSLLKFDVPHLFTVDTVRKQIVQLCSKNGCDKLARIRLSVFRGNGGLYDDDKALQYLIECWPLNATINKLNENGLVIGVYTDAEKSCDKFSHLKSANFLPYSMAALFAKENKLNDCLVVNNTGGIADSTIANVFIINDDIIRTPALTEGCIAGVMRRHLVETLQDAGYTVLEESISVRDVKNADEIFLSNAINGIRWVRQFGDTVYTSLKTTEIYTRFVKTIFV